MEAGEGSSSSGGEDTTKRKYPLGFRFKPEPEELVEYYLLPKLQDRPSVPNDAIIEADVYECHPGIMINERYRDRGVDNVWYFLSPRTRKYRNGVRPSRRTADNRGRWKPSSGKESKKEKEEEEEAAATETKLCRNGTIKYCVTSLAYHVGPPKNEKKTMWLMHEYTLPEYEIKSGACDGDMTLDRYALCKIYISPSRSKDKDDWEASDACEEAGASSSSEPGPPAPESGPGTSAPTTTLSEKQAGKRPAVKQQPLGRATQTKRARQLPNLAPGAPQAPMLSNGGVGTGALLRVGSGYVPGLQAPIPWPPATSNRLQGPVQLPQRVYQHNGRPVAAPPCHGQRQAPVQGLPGSSSLRPPSSVSALHRNSLGRTTVMRPPLLPSSGSGQIMMRPQNGMARQTLPPQTAAQPLRQLVPPPPPAAQPLPQLTGVDWNDPRSQRVISQLIAELKARNRSDAPGSVQQQFTTASNLPPPPQQQPAFNAVPARADAVVARPEVGGQQQHQHQQQPQQSSPAIPATSASGPDGAAAAADEKPASTNELPARWDNDGGTDKEALDSNSDDKIFAELATMTLCQAAPGWGNVKEEDI